MTAARAYGRVFDRIAVEYDRHRPTYPDELVDHACRMAGLVAGDSALEIGCGSGQLTRALVDRGLEVTALDPGERMIELAARNVPRNLEPPPEFIRARFEDAVLPEGRFRAVFSAAAFHWVDPDVSWSKAAALLAPGGTLVLIQYCGLIEDGTRAAHDALMTALTRSAPEVAALWPPARDLPSIRNGSERRRRNVSEVWDWLGGYDLIRPAAADLFDHAQIALVPIAMEHTAQELTATFRTTSMHHRLEPAQQTAFAREVAAVAGRFGPAVRSSAVAVAVTAQRTQANV